MIRSSIRFSLALLLAVCGAASSEELPGRRPGPNEREGRIRRVEGARHDRRHELKPIARPGLGEGDTTWLLSPQVFSKLSSAGRRRALALNGLLPSARSTSSTFAPQAREAVAVTPFANVRVNDPARDEVGHTQSEAWVAASGDRVVVGFNDAASSFAGYAFSTDGGSTFTHRRLPDPDTGQNFGDPVVVFGSGSTVYYGTLAVSNNKSLVGVAKSTDGGATFGTPVDASTTATSPSDNLDKDWLAVDTGSASPYQGNVYVSWSTFKAASAGDFIQFARSTDGGTTWQPPIALSADDGSFAVQGSSIAVAPDGTVYVAYLDGRIASPSGIAVVKSTDGGVTFGPPRAAAALVEPTGGTGSGGLRTNSFPMTAVDNAGTLHIVYAGIARENSYDRGDVFYVRSTDGGATFSAPRKLNDDGTTTFQIFPSIAAAADGTLAVRWWDRRNDARNDSLTDTYMTTSADAGLTWSPNVRLTDHNWALGPVEPLNANGYHGDYDGVTAEGGAFHVVWSDERGTDPDVYYARVLQSATASPDFNVSGAAPWIMVRAEQSTDVDILTSAQNGFSGALALTVSAPAGLATAFDGSSVPAGQKARLTVTASSAAPGTYVLAVAAAGGGLTRKTTLRVTVFDSARTAPLPINITPTPGFTQSMAAPVLDSTGALHFVYDDDTAFIEGFDVFYRRTLDGGRSWSAPRRLSTAGVVSLGAEIFVDRHDVLYVLFSAEEDGAFPLFLTKSSDGGVTFTPPSRVTPAGLDTANAGLAFDLLGSLLLAWYETASDGTASIRVARSTDGGATFSTPTTVPDNNINNMRPLTPAYDSKGRAYLAWTRTPSGLRSFVQLAVAADGINFSAPATISGTATAFAPHLSVAPDDTLHVVHYNRIGSGSTATRDVVAIRSTDGGATFTPSVDVSKSDGQSTFPFVLADGKAVTVVWEDTTGVSEPAQPDVFFARSTDGGATFSTPANLSGNHGQSTSASAVADFFGDVHVFWTDDSPAQPDLFWVRLATGAPNRPPTGTLVSPVGGSAAAEAGMPLTFSATAADPDAGDAASISWDFGDGTTGSGPSASKSFANPGTYTVTLIVRDRGGLTMTRSVTVNVRTPTLTGPELLLPVALDSPGLAGARFRTEMTLASRASAPATVLLQYTSSAGSGSGYASVALAPGEQRIVPDALDYFRQQGLAIPEDGTSQVGTVRAVYAGASAAGDVFIGGRTYTPGAGGTFGLFYADALSTNDSLTVPGLQQNDAQRSNLALVNAGLTPVTLRVHLYGTLGEDLGTLADVSLGPLGWKQLGRPLEGRAASGYAVVTRVSGTARFTAYGVLNDAVTSDGSFLPPLPAGDATSGERLIPVVLDAQGVAHFVSELTLTNFTSAPLPLTLVYTAGLGTGGGAAPITLAPGEQRILPDAITALRQLGIPIPEAASVAGSLLVRPPAGTPATALAGGARTFTRAASGGSFGVFYPGLTAAECAAQTAFIHGLQQSDRQRANVAIVNRGDAGDAITLRLTYFREDGTLLPNPETFTLTAGLWKQYNQPLLSRGASAGYVKVDKLSGASLFAAYGVLNDAATSDGSYIPMRK